MEIYKYWYLLILFVVTLSFLAVWVYGYDLTSDIQLILSLITAYAAVIAGIFTTYSAIGSFQKADVYLGTADTSFKPNSVEEVELSKEDGLVILPLTLLNNGTRSVDTVYVDITFSTDVFFEVRATRGQQPGGMIYSIEPKLFKRDNSLSGWINTPIWSKGVLDLNQENWIYIKPEMNDVIEFTWRTRTMDFGRKGKVKLLIQ
jgi:hypothetical protein